MVTVGKSLIIDSPLNIQRLSVANGDLVEAVAVSPKEVLINGKAPGETSLIVWQQGGTRLVYDLMVRVSPVKLEAVRQQIARDFPDDDINVTFDNDTAFVRGTVKDVIAAERVMAIAATLGKAVNLLHVKVPPVEPQILLKVRFADVDRSASMQLGVNLASGAFNQSRPSGTGSLRSAPTEARPSPSPGREHFPVPQGYQPGGRHPGPGRQEPAGDAGRAQRAGHQRQAASFLAGGEFPFPMVQPGQRNRARITHLLARIRRPAQFPARGYAARHHPHGGDAGGQLARLHQLPSRHGRHRSRL